MNQKRIPDTDSIQELAKFWDTHDVTDFDSELEEVEGAVFSRPNGSAITVKLQPEEASAVHKLAESKGVDDAELIHQWVVEKIHAN